MVAEPTSAVSGIVTVVKKEPTELIEADPRAAVVACMKEIVAVVPGVKYVPATVTDPPILTVPDERAIAAEGLGLGVVTERGVGLAPGVVGGDSPGVGEAAVSDPRT